MDFAVRPYITHAWLHLLTRMTVKSSQLDVVLAEQPGCLKDNLQNFLAYKSEAAI